MHLPDVLFSFIHEEIASLNPEYLTFLYRDSESVPPKSKTTPVNLIDIISRIEVQLKQNYEHIIQQNLGKQEAGLRIVSKLDQMIGYNLQTADTALHSPESENRFAEISGNIEHIV